jgi:hypothetical protein
LIAHRKLAVGDEFWFIDCVARRVTVPVCAFLCWIAQIVDLVSWVVRVNVDRYAADCAMKLVRGIFNAPKPGFVST